MKKHPNHKRETFILRRDYLLARLKVSSAASGHLFVELLKLYIMEASIEGLLRPFGVISLLAVGVVLLVIFFVKGE